MDVNDSQISPSIKYILKSMKPLEKSSSLVSAKYISTKDPKDFYGHNFDPD